VRDLSKPPRRFPLAAIRLFRFLRWLGTDVWPGRRAYRAYLARGGIELTEEDVPVPDLPAGLDGLRIVQISDLHAGPFLDRRSLDQALDLVRAARPDVLVITGDFITDRAEDVHKLGSVFAHMPATLGKFAVFGNHDYRQRREGEIAAVLRRQGVTALRNASVGLERGGAVLRLVGLEDIEEGRRVDLDAALEGSRPDDGATVLLCHHPDVAAMLPDGRFDLVLCGHTHGGQVLMPGLWSPWRRWLPEHLSGTAPLPGGRGVVHVNRGLGVLVLPVRWGARAQVSCLTLRPAT
jgi:predicted MPP superfamily phosphohydrolase